HVVADGRLVADAGRVGPPLDVDHGEVLDIGAPPDADGVHVTAEDGVVPDRRFLPDLHVPDDLGAVGDENRRMKAWGDSLEEADRHQAASSGRRGGTGGRSTSATSVPERALGVARSMRTRARAPAGAEPSKFTVRFSGVRPKRRSGWEREGPSTTTSTPCPATRTSRPGPTSSPAISVPMRRCTAWSRSRRSTFTSCGTGPQTDSLRPATVRGRGEKMNENWLS